MRINHNIKGAYRPLIDNIKVMWGIPCFNGEVWVEHMRSVAHAMGALVALNIDCKIEPHVGDAFIEKARNMIVAKFLADESYTHLIMCDGDQSFDVKTLIKLLMSNHEFTAACPPIKDKTERYAVEFDELKKDGLFIEVERVGSGFIVLKRSMLLKMVNEYQELRNHAYDHNNGNGYSLFEFIKQDKTIIGEDYAFCDRWRDIGGKIHVLIDAEMQHKGVKVWSGTLTNIPEINSDQQIMQEHIKEKLNDFTEKYGGGLQLCK